jgi:hypothetical protein
MSDNDSCSGLSMDDSFVLKDSLTRTDSVSVLEPQRDAEDSQRNTIANQGAVEVSRSRRMVTAMLLLTAALVITTTYIFLSREETDEFEKSVRQISNKRILELTASSNTHTHTLCFATCSSHKVQRLSKTLLGSTVKTE